MENPSTFEGYSFVVTAPTELPTFWGLVEPGLEEVRKKMKPGWEGVLVAGEIVTGRATLIVIYKEKQYVGFVVVKSIFPGVPTKHVLLVWVAYGGRKNQRIRDGMIQFVEAYGKALQCKEVTMETPRLGWGRVLTPYGWELDAVKFTKEL